MDDVRHQQYQDIERLQQYKGHDPSAMGGPQSFSSPAAVRPVARPPIRINNPPADGSRKKRARNFAVIPTGEATAIEGVEERKAEDIFIEARSPLPLGETPTQPGPSAHLKGAAALKKYSIPAEGAREGGPDYIPCKWAPELLLEDIPWNQLPLVNLAIAKT